MKRKTANKMPLEVRGRPRSAIAAGVPCDEIASHPLWISGFRLSAFLDLSPPLGCR
jgi:hypothetical protein